MASTVPIIADKELFRLWYEFYRIALSSQEPEIKKALKKSSSYYADWGVIENVKFDDWWKKHRSLFHDTNVVRLSKTDEVRSRDSLCVIVPTTKSYGDIVKEFKLLLAVELPEKVKRRKTPPSHRFSPTEIQGVKRDSLRMMLDLQKNVFSDTSLKGKALTQRVTQYFSSQRYQRKKNTVPMTFLVDNKNQRDDHSDEAERNIRRYRQKAKKLVLNVASGKFPGSY